MERWKIWLTTGFIALYVCFLSWGTLAHTLKVGGSLSAINYFVVWDMFCGWSAWDSRTHVIAEGASGQFYDVKEPWGEFHPFGSIARIQYDSSNDLLAGHINNVLRHTQHETIDRVFVVEEAWPKQYNLPPNLFAHYFNRSNDKLSYFHLRAVCKSDGTPLTKFPSWHDQQMLTSLYEIPRLQRQASQATSLYSTLYNPRANPTTSPPVTGGVGLTTN